ncbi:hypothetical protein P154DRAFT_536521 [Amniculicola lignicola CBS 123094]|uniref:Uncharacterized protein n=1 Tax=Amniculicola lignicola CBS 123094 TaxID=1392246 RepID=A0A6A5WDV3_9PLEO|nr:hypothetical protein P154DRAFT_536521 [Amniculicola lignicola CBS 123094]
MSESSACRPESGPLKREAAQSPEYKGERTDKVWDNIPLDDLTPRPDTPKANDPHSTSPQRLQDIPASSLRPTVPNEEADATPSILRVPNDANTDTDISNLPAHPNTPTTDHPPTASPLPYMPRYAAKDVYNTQNHIGGQLVRDVDCPTHLTHLDSPTSPDEKYIPRSSSPDSHYIPSWDPPPNWKRASSRPSSTVTQSAKSTPRSEEPSLGLALRSRASTVGEPPKSTISPYAFPNIAPSRPINPNNPNAPPAPLRTPNRWRIANASVIQERRAHRAAFDQLAENLQRRHTKCHPVVVVVIVIAFLVLMVMPLAVYLSAKDGPIGGRGGPFGFI